MLVRLLVILIISFRIGPFRLLDACLSTVLSLPEVDKPPLLTKVRVNLCKAIR